MKKAMTESERAVLRRLRRALRVEFQKAGHGSQSRILEELEIKNAAFDAAFARGSAKILMLLRVLDALKVDPGRFWAQIFPARELPKGKPPAGVLSAFDRLKEMPDD